MIVDRGPRLPADYAPSGGGVMRMEDRGGRVISPSSSCRQRTYIQRGVHLLPLRGLAGGAMGLFSLSLSKPTFSH
jgi:hypothetical protein